MLPDGKFFILDGDRIAILAAILLKQLIDEADVSVSMGVIQTAYANGGATQYLTEKLSVPVIFTKTGVKYLHAKAKEFNVGVYFEANGHGTVLFDDTFSLQVQDTLKQP